MKKKLHKKLHLRIETLRHLSMVRGNGTDYMCNGGDTRWDTCSEPPPEPSVNGCGSGALACASSPPGGCGSTYPGCG